MQIHKDSVSLAAYESMAEYYFNDVDKKGYNAYYERPATLSLLPAVAGKQVVDAGCAAGWYTQWLLSKGAIVTALDFSPRMIQMTRKRVGDRAEIIQTDLNRPIEFIGDQSVDIIISSLTLHYLKDWTVVMREFHRILVQGGILVFSVHHPFMDFAVFKKENYFLTELLTDEWETPNGSVEVNFYRRPLSAIVSFLFGAGFIIEQLQEPMPTEKFKEAQPEEYERLLKKPHFLFVRARKP